MNETEICRECGKVYIPLFWDPHYDFYGLMGTGYTYSLYCKECREKAKKK